MSLSAAKTAPKFILGLNMEPPSVQIPFFFSSSGSRISPCRMLMPPASYWNMGPALTSSHITSVAAICLLYRSPSLQVWLMKSMTEFPSLSSSSILRSCWCVGNTECRPRTSSLEALCISYWNTKRQIPKIEYKTKTKICQRWAHQVL